MARIRRLKLGTQGILATARSRKGPGYSKKTRKMIAHTLRTQRKLQGNRAVRSAQGGYLRSNPYRV